MTWGSATSGIAGFMAMVGPAMLVVSQTREFGKLNHSQTMTTIDKQDVVRMNRDTLYCSGIFDLDAAPVRRLSHKMVRRGQLPRMAPDPIDHGSKRRRSCEAVMPSPCDRRDNARGDCRSAEWSAAGRSWPYPGRPYLGR